MLYIRTCPPKRNVNLAIKKPPYILYLANEPYISKQYILCVWVKTPLKHVNVIS